MNSSGLRPARALVHPVWWIALAVLVANDHVFKGSGLLPAAITGKLSDFVGLLVAPVLFAALCRTRTARGFAWAHALVALGFSAINLSPAVAGAVEGATAATPFPWAIAVDPTDLIALPMVALSYALFLPWCAAPAPVGRVLGRAGFGLGMLACVATSPPPEPPVEPLPQPPQNREPIPGEVIFPTEGAALMIANQTATEQLVRLRRLDVAIGLDCNSVGQDPAGRLARDWFAPAELWSVEPGRAIPVRGGGQCTAYLVDGPELPMRLVFFGSQSYPNQTITTEVAAVPSRLALPIALPEGTAAWGSHPALFAAPPQVREAVEPVCQTVPEGFGVEWSAVPVGTRLIGELKTAPDGCTAFDFEPQDERAVATRWFVCGPAIELPFAAGDEVVLSVVHSGAGGVATGVEVSGPSGRLVLGRGQTVPASIDVVGVQTSVSGCAPTFGCGASVPVAVSLQHVEGPPTPIAVGEPVAIGRGTLRLTRAERREVVDSRCEAVGASLGTVVIESIFVETY